MGIRLKTPLPQHAPVNNEAPASTGCCNSTNALSLAAHVMLLASGTAALIFQTVWIRQLSLVIGIDVFAVTVAISSFFAGLAVGSLVFGLWAERANRPLQLYAGLETFVGISGLISTLLLYRAPMMFIALEHKIGAFAWGLPFLLVGIPATLMGGTLPVLIKAIGDTDHRLSDQGGRLYAMNTAGAIVGTLLSAFILMPRLGLFDSAVVAAILNIGSALFAIAVDDRIKGVKEPSVANTYGSTAKDEQPLLGLFLYAVSGGIALGYEVIWSQIIVQWTSTRSFAFATVVAVYLAGLTIGSGIGAWRSRSTPDHWGQFGVLISSAGMTALLLMLSLGSWLDLCQVRAATAIFRFTGSEILAMSGRFLLAAGWVLFVPALLLGSAFPVALQLSGSNAAPGRSSGMILAANTFGGIVGTLVSGFLLIPRLGVERSLAALAVGACLVGAVACLRAEKKYRWMVGAVCLLTAIANTQLSSDQFGKLLAARRNGQLIYHASGASGTVAVLEQGRPGHKFRRLYIQGVSNSGDSMTSLRYMRLQALLPLLIHSGEPKSALVIGLGTGITAGVLLSYDGLDRRVCAELVPEVITAASTFVGNNSAPSDPRLEVRRVDGRQELLSRNESYDLVTLEPPPPSASGVANLYSTEFYRLAKTRLEQHGIVAQWLPLPTQNDADTRSLVRSFLDVFEHASLWSTELHEMMLVGSSEPLLFDVRTIRRRFERPGVEASLLEVGIASPAALLATYVCNRSGLEAYADNALPVTDDHPRIEFGPWTTPTDFRQTFQNIMRFRTEIELINADEQYRADVFEQQAILQLFYSASISAYEGDRQNWESSMNAALRADPKNLYFQWFTGQGPR